MVSPKMGVLRSSPSTGNDYNNPRPMIRNDPRFIFHFHFLYLA